MASPRVVGFVGLDELSVEMAALLVKSGFQVKAFAAADSAWLTPFLEVGGSQCHNISESGKDVTALIVTSADQVDDELFCGNQGITKWICEDAAVLIRSTMPLRCIQKLEKHLNGEGTRVIVGLHVFKGVSDAFGGKLMVTAVGRLEETKKAEPLLAEMSDKLYVLDCEVSAASKVRMVTELLKTIHFAASLEAMFLGVAARIHPWILYDIISNAAGSSRVFVDIVPKLLKGDNSLQSPLISLLNDVGAVMDAAKELTFPLPLLAIARQQLIRGYLCKVGDHASDELVEVWEKYFGVNIRDVASNESYSPTDLAEQIVGSSISVKRIGFLGLGAMGFGMAAHLLISNFCVLGYDVYEPSMSRFTKVGGLVGHSPAEVSKDVDVLIIMVANEAQAESVLFGDGGSVSALPAGSSIILSSTVSPGYVTQLEQRLKGENKNLKLVDAPVSGGVKRAADGTLTIMASGTKEALEHAGSVLSALSEKLYIINGGCGAASSVKMVNQLLAGVHIAAASEAMAFGAKVGLDTRMLFDIITHSEGNSWMFANRVPHMLDNDYTPYSAVDIFVKDLGIVNKEGSVLAVPLHLSAVAHQQFVSGSASGWGRLDDAAVVKVYEKLTGVTVEGKHTILKKEKIFNSLPPEWSVDPVEGIQMLAGQNASKVLIVLDDDPTGTQTVHGIEVLTEWSIDSLAEQLSKRASCFFILTNSRSLSSEKAYALIQEICKNINTAAKLAGNIGFSVVLRGDSTLRGHFPEEADAAVSVLGEMDAWVICPFFLQGGRYTINDIHYVADSDSLVPAGDTEFSKDAAFGYKASNLREWVEEKTRGRIRANRVASIPIQLLRRGGPSAVCEHLCSLPKGSTCIVNAASERDVAVFALGMMQAEIRGKSFLCRTAASFVSARIGIKPKPPMSPDNLSTDWKRIGGLIVVGSYVPKTTKQIEGLKAQLGHVIKCIEVSVDNVSMKPSEVREEEISYAAETADAFLKLGKDTLLMTSRDLIKGKSPSESLEINFKVSSALVEIVRRIETRPRYILAKGGITSSDLATKALEARQAKVVGQALPGVPLWELGPGSRHPGIPYIVFPGNVGDSNALAEVVQKWSYPHRSLSTKDLLNNAEKGGYAVGAFNVYNLEGVEAVFAAAEAERSPAILQVHPGALKVGGHPLIACCVSAAQRASVPITVHFDHGSSLKELVEVLELGFNSVMVDGSHLPFKENISYTRYLSTLAHSKNITVEAELGRLSGTEDDLTVEDYEARLTDLNQAEEFIDETGIDALAVCIGNVHGTYPTGGPILRLDLLKELHQLASKKGVVLVLHGASGLPKELIKECIVRGVRKFNVNTEVRNAYLESPRENNKDLVHIMSSAKEAMKAVIAEKMHLFGSAGRA